MTKTRRYQSTDTKIVTLTSTANAVRFESCPKQGVVFHEYANLFPMLTGEAYDALVEDIAVNGVLQPIVTVDGAILDGRNRYMAARQLGIEYPVTDYDGADPLAFVVSHNLARRHLSESQRAMVASKLANLNKGRPSDNSANLRNKDAAEMLNVSTRSVETARKVRDASPELAEKVESGSLTVSLAEKVLDLPKEDAAAVIEALPEDAKEVARDAVKRAHVAANSGNNEWYTPDHILDRARDVLGGFDLDPASSVIANERVQAAKIFTSDDDGLAVDWPIGRIWMNPPYAQPLIDKFSERFAVEIERGSTGIVLVNNATETAWFQCLANVSTAICFPKSRVRFLDPDGNPGAPLQGQAALYAGHDPSKFRDAFDALGFVVFK